MKIEDDNKIIVCSICDSRIEGDICEECSNSELEELNSLLYDYSEFVARFEMLIGDGRDISFRLKGLGEWAVSERMELYLLNRMENFISGGEMFGTEEVNEHLKERIMELMFFKD